VTDGSVTSDVADALANDLVQDGPVFVIGQRGDHYSVSARCPPGVDLDLEALMRTIAETCGGRGGGHHRQGRRPGRDSTRVDRFRQELLEAVPA